MDDVLHAVNDLSYAFETFKEEHNAKLRNLETKSINRREIPNMNYKEENTHYFTAFKKYLRKGDERAMTAVTQKSLSTVNGEEGGFFIPSLIENRLSQHIEDFSPIRRLANVVQITTSSIEFLLDQKGPEAGWVQETELRDETATPTLRKVKIPVHELYTKPRVTEKLLADSAINIEEWLSDCVAKKLAQMENDAFINGDGEHKPKGFLNYDTVAAEDWEWGKLEEVTTGAKGAFSDEGADCLLELMGALKPIYLKDAVWIMSRSAYVEVQKLKDDNGRYILNPGTNEERRPMIFGYPVEIIEDMPALVKGQASKSIVFANLKEAYQIVEHQGAYMLRDPYSAKPFVEFYTTKRVGGDVINFEAIKVLNFKE